MLLESRASLNIVGGDRSAPTIVVNAVFLGIAWFAVLLRVYTRVWLVKIFYLEDWFMVFATMVFTVYCAGVIRQSEIVNVGHNVPLPLQSIVDATMLLLVSESTYLWTVLLLKVSVGLFFLRLAIEKWQKYLVWFLIALSTSFSFMLFIFSIFQCGYFESMLDFVIKKATPGECMSPYVVSTVTYTHGAITAFTDWVFVILPIFILKTSKMPVKEKIIVGCLMAFASLGGIASLIRFKYVPGIAAPNDTFFTSVSDIAIWSCIEPGVGIAAGSLICLRPLFRKQLNLMSRGINYVSGSSGIKTFKERSYGYEMNSSTSNLRGPLDSHSARDIRDEEHVYDNRELEANWPFPAPVLQKQPHASEKDLHAVLDTRHYPRSNSAAANPTAPGLPLGVYGKNSQTHTYSEDSMR